MDKKALFGWVNKNGSKKMVITLEGDDGQIAMRFAEICDGIVPTALVRTDIGFAVMNTSQSQSEIPQRNPLWLEAGEFFGQTPIKASLVITK